MNTAGPDPRRWQALALVCVAFFMTVLDVSIVNVALPSIGRSLHFSETGLQWVITAYAITFGGFLLLGGRAGDILGRKRMFLVGVTLFSIASLVCGLAGSTGVLVAARTVQGLGAAIVSPATLSIITTTFEEGAERNKALGIWGAMGGSGAAAGVLFGGILTKYLGWEWIFFVNVPVGALVLALAPGIVRESRAADVGRNFDVVGASSVTAGITLLVYAISKAPVDGWSDSTTIILLIAAAALIVFFVAWETRVENPLMPLSIFRIRTLAGANIAANRIRNAEVRIGDVYAPVDDLVFDHILCNPPIRAGRDIVDRIIAEAPSHLLEGGSLWLVARTRQGSDTLRLRMTKAFDGADVVKRGSGYKVLRSVKSGA